MKKGTLIFSIIGLLVIISLGVYLVMKSKSVTTTTTTNVTESGTTGLSSLLQNADLQGIAQGVTSALMFI